MATFPAAVRFEGRWELATRHTTWCGASVHFRTASSEVRVELGALTARRSTASSQHNVLWKFGDEAEPHTKRVKGAHTLVLGPPEGSGPDVAHDVVVMLCDWGAALHIVDIHTTDGRPLLAHAPAQPVRPLLFIGASLVAGYSPPFHVVLPHGAYQAFPAVAARTLRARGVDVCLEIVAYPGLQLMTTRTHDAGMEDLFWDGKQDLGGWDTRARESPQDIFICVGTNDQAWGEDTDAFIEHYRAFLVRLRDSYRTSCKRIFVISPFGIFRGEKRLAVFEPHVQHMVEALGQSWAADQDGTRLYHVQTEGWIDKSLTCDGLHPTVQGHERISEKLIEFLESCGAVRRS